MSNRCNCKFIPLLFGLMSGVSYAACMPGGADFNEASRLFDAAYQESSSGGALGLLDESISLCPSFRAYYAKGMLLEQQGDKAGADLAYQYASDYADVDQGRLVRGRRALLKEEQDCQSLTVLREIHEYYQSSGQQEPGWLQQGRLAVEERLAAKSSSAMFIESQFDACRAAGLSPRVDVRVHFALSRADLTSQGQEELSQLGKVLSADKYADYEINIIGHTDKQGKKGATADESRRYNQSLSEQRAATVGQELQRRFPALNGRIKTSGKGQSKLLFNGDSEREHQLNRRVEVVLYEKQKEEW